MIGASRTRSGIQPRESGPSHLSPTEKHLAKPLTAHLGAVLFCAIGALAPAAHAWDHPGHMLTAAVAYAEIERARPALIDSLGLLFLRHPDTAPFWVAAGEARGKERVRRMFVECARWADDSKFTPRDMLTWHSALWAIVAKDAPAQAKAAADARKGRPAGQALEALALNYAMVANAESSPAERALGLCWVLHIAGDIHQPMHVSDLFSKDFPAGDPRRQEGVPRCCVRRDAEEVWHD